MKFFDPNICIPSVFFISSIILYVISLNSAVDAVHPCHMPLVTSISISLFFSSCIFVLSSLYIQSLYFDYKVNYLAAYP